MENGAVTFSPTDLLAEVFEHYRQQELSAGEHELLENYSYARFNLHDQEQLTIYYENGQPTMFSTIFRREWWLPGTYRITNRTWKIPRTTEFNKKVYEGIYATTISQLEWCYEQPEFRAALMTRENNDLILRAIAKGMRSRGHETFEGHRIWTCRGNREDCHQYAILWGDRDIVDEWPYRR
jgi:hypothetical protein